MNETKADKAFTELVQLMTVRLDEIKHQIEDVRQELKQDISVVQEDVDTIASVFGFRRDTDGKLKRT